MITEYKEKRLIDYITPGGKYLIRFAHGLGDTIMFMPLFRFLISQYPESHFDLYLECGQEQIWESVHDKDTPGYDEVFHLDFPMSESSGTMKQHKCALEEIGFSPEELGNIAEVDILPYLDSPLVACHFQGTALPNSVNCPEEKAKIIWQDIKDAGMIPMETHFQHTFHNPKNKKFPWIDLSVRNYRATLPNLFGLMVRCHAAICVASGPFVVALSMMPRRLMYLEKQHPLGSYTSRGDVASVRIENIEPGMIREWLQNRCGK